QLSAYPACCARLSQSSNVWREMRKVDFSGSKTLPTSTGKCENASAGISIVDSTVRSPFRWTSCLPPTLQVAPAAICSRSHTRHTWRMRHECQGPRGGPGGQLVGDGRAG